MIDFIVCDDNRKFLEHEKKIIDNFMMKYDFEYSCNIFTDYDEEFKKVFDNQERFKVYMLDIQTKSASGLDIARIIREQYDDWTSIIIIVTAFNELKYEALGNRLFLLDFINKLNSCDEKIREDLEIAIKHYNNRKKSLHYEYNHVIKNIEFRHIIYIEKEIDSKRCLIKTSYGREVINKNLNETFKMLDKRFVKISRSMIVNIDFISEYNIKENKITFKTGETTNQISRGMKKGLKNYARSSC